MQYASAGGFHVKVKTAHIQGDRRGIGHWHIHSEGSLVQGFKESVVRLGIIEMKARKIPRAKVRMLASFGCSFLEIAKYFACDESTIRQQFRTAYEQGRQDMKIKLRQAQWKAALEHGNTALLIFLGKNVLGQSEKTDLEAANNLESVLRTCGFEDARIGKTGSKSEEVVEFIRLSADSAATGRSQFKGKIQDKLPRA